MTIICKLIKNFCNVQLLLIPAYISISSPLFSQSVPAMAIIKGQIIGQAGPLTEQEKQYMTSNMQDSIKQLKLISLPEDVADNIRQVKMGHDQVVNSKPIKSTFTLYLEPERFTWFTGPFDDPSTLFISSWTQEYSDSFAYSPFGKKMIFNADRNNHAVQNPYVQLPWLLQEYRLNSLFKDITTSTESGMLQKVWKDRLPIDDGFANFKSIAVKYSSLNDLMTTIVARSKLGHVETFVLEYNDVAKSGRRFPRKVHISTHRPEPDGRLHWTYDIVFDSTAENNSVDMASNFFSKMSNLEVSDYRFDKTKPIRYKYKAHVSKEELAAMIEQQLKGRAQLIASSDSGRIGIYLIAGALLAVAGFFIWRRTSGG